MEDVHSPVGPRETRSHPASHSAVWRHSGQRDRKNTGFISQTDYGNYNGRNYRQPGDTLRSMKCNKNIRAFLTKSL